LPLLCRKRVGAFSFFPIYKVTAAESIMFTRLLVLPSERKYEVRLD